MPENDTVSKYIHPMFPVPTDICPKGSLDKKILCILFDIYGTLFISESGDISLTKKKSNKRKEINSLLKKFKFNKNPEDVLEKYFYFIEKKHIELKAQGIEFPEVEIDKIWMSVLEINDRPAVKKFAAEFELIINPVYPMPNLKKMLDFCIKSNLQIGIISNAQFYTKYLFKWFLGSYPDKLGFNPVIYSYNFGHGKPSMLLFKYAADKLKQKNIQPESVLYVGNDMLKDIYPAKKAGFKTALFAGDKRSLRLRKDNPLCKDLSPDIVITDLIQILDHI